MIRLNQIIIQTNPDFCSTIENRLFSSVSSLTGSLKLVTQKEEENLKNLWLLLEIGQIVKVNLLTEWVLIVALVELNFNFSETFFVEFTDSIKNNNFCQDSIQEYLKLSFWYFLKINSFELGNVTLGELVNLVQLDLIQWYNFIFPFGLFANFTGFDSRCSTLCLCFFF